MTLQELRYVVAVAEYGHFGRAASACDVSQPTISTQIKNLELELGVTLFERTTKAVIVTVVGQEIARRARHLLEEADAIARIGQHESTSLSGPFSLGVIPTLGPYLLPWLVPALRKRYPDLRLVLREDLTAPLLDRLGSHRLDAALVALPVSDHRLEMLPLFDEPFWFAEPKGRHPAVTAPMGEDELRGRRLLLLTEGHCLRDQALAICGTTDADDEGDFRATSLETILQMVATGMGSTLVPAMARGEAHASSVHIRPLEAGVGRRIGLAWRRSHPKPRDIQLLAETLRDHLPPCVHGV